MTVTRASYTVHVYTCFTLYTCTLGEFVCAASPEVGERKLKLFQSLVARDVAGGCPTLALPNETKVFVTLQEYTVHDPR